MTTAPAPAPVRPAAPAHIPLTSGHLPRWAPWALLVGSLAVFGAIYGVLGAAAGGEFSIAGWLILSVIAYLVLIYTISRIVEGARRAFDRFVTGIVSSAFAIAMVPLVSVGWTVVSNGIARFDATFFSSSMRGIVGEGGGAVHAIWGTLLITLTAAIISVPIGLMTAIYLIEYGQEKRLARAITFLVDVMTGIPSIVAGLFAYALFALIFGPGVRMGFAGAVALSVLMIPVVVRSCEEMLRLVPNELREAAYALGVPKWLTIIKVVLRTSLAGIVTSIVLAIARVIGETAPLLLTVGIVTTVNTNMLDGRVATLPVFAYSQYAQDSQGVGADRAWGAALVLIVMIMLLNLVARFISRRFSIAEK